MLWEEFEKENLTTSEKLKNFCVEKEEIEIYSYLLSYRDDYDKLAAIFNTCNDTILKLKEYLEKILPLSTQEKLREISVQNIDYPLGAFNPKRNSEENN